MFGCLEWGTSVASALTAETVFEIRPMKCRPMSDVDMPARGGQNPKFSGFSILATPTIEIFRFLTSGIQSN